MASSPPAPWGVAKPDPTAFQMALEALGLAPEETLYLDDDPENVEVARRLGLRAEVYSPYQRVVGN